MVEQKILSACASSRDWHDKVKAYLDLNSLPALGKTVFNAIDEFYSKDSKAITVDMSIISERLKTAMPKQAESILEYISSISPNVSNANVISLIIDKHKEKLSHDMAIAAGTKDFARLDKLALDYSKAGELEEEENNSKVYKAPNIFDMQDAFSAENLIPIYPEKLNELLGGGVPRQSQVGIVARPDVGKSTVAMNILVPACMNGFKGLYLGNEDPNDVMVLRAYSRFLSASRDKILKNPQGAYEEAMRRGLDNFTFVGLDPGTMLEVSEYIEECKPDVVVIDQLRNMKTLSKNGNMTEDINTLAKEARALAKHHNLVMIIITQAGDSASNKVILDYTDVEYSNTGFAAQLDLMIGVGQNATLKSSNSAVFSFPKNKITSPLQPMEVELLYSINKVRAK